MFSNKISFLVFFLLIFAVCANAKNKKYLTVKQCSYVDEYFNYCEKKFLKEYNDSLRRESENFSKNYILKLVGKNDKSYHGLVAIEKKTGNVYTSIYNLKIDEGGWVKFNHYSNKICFLGEINSKSLSFNRKGEGCLLFSQGIFKLDEENVRKIQAKSDIFFLNDKLMCGAGVCRMQALTLKNLSRISKGYDSELKFLVNERGFDTEYYDASDKKNILYIFLYSEGDEDLKNLSLAYMSGGILKFKSLGVVSSFRVDGTNSIFANGKFLELD